MLRRLVLINLVIIKSFLGCSDGGATKNLKQRDVTQDENTQTKREQSTNDASSKEATPAETRDSSQSPAESGQDDRDNPILESALKQGLSTLSSADMAGRGSGTEGHWLAQSYIVDQLKQAGINPGNEGSFFQEFSFSNSRTITTSNIIGVIPGTDPNLKNEYIILGAHLDHLGMNGSRIFFGADDNASGVVTVLNIAKAVAKRTFSRSIVFIFFSAEELGLLGSQFYVNNPIYPLEDTHFMLNVDMIGRADGQMTALGAAATPILLSHLRLIADKTEDLSITTTGDAGNRSDHAPFAAKGIPITTFHTGLHADYHQPSDTSAKIDFAGLTLGANLILDLTIAVLNDTRLSTNLRLTSASMQRIPSTDIVDFKAYFENHGTGHQPQDSMYDHALMPGQPL